MKLGTKQEADKLEQLFKKKVGEELPELNEKGMHHYSENEFLSRMMDILQSMKKEIDKNAE